MVRGGGGAVVTQVVWSTLPTRTECIIQPPIQPHLLRVTPSPFLPSAYSPSSCRAPPLSHPRPHTPFLSTYQDDVSKMSPDQLKVVLEEYKTMHKECKALTQKMAELDGEAQEHQ